MLTIWAVSAMEKLCNKCVLNGWLNAWCSMSFLILAGPDPICSGCSLAWGAHSWVRGDLKALTYRLHSAPGPAPVFHMEPPSWPRGAACLHSYKQQQQHLGHRMHHRHTLCAQSLHDGSPHPSCHPQSLLIHAHQLFSYSGAVGDPNSTGHVCLSGDPLSLLLVLKLFTTAGAHKSRLRPPGC